jgi:hypothetical protein
MHLLLPPQLQDLPMRIGVLRGHKSWARSRSVLRHESSRLVPHPTSVTKGLRPHGPGPPLWGLFRPTMQTLPTRRGLRLVLLALSFLTRCRLGRRRQRLLVCDVGLRGGGEVEEARGPVAWGGARALAAGLAGERCFGLKKRDVSGRQRFGGG